MGAAGKNRLGSCSPALGGGGVPPWAALENLLTRGINQNIRSELKDFLEIFLINFMDSASGSSIFVRIFEENQFFFEVF